MKQNLWITLITYLAYCVDKELAKAGWPAMPPCLTFEWNLDPNSMKSLALGPDESSSPGESHPQALTEPYVKLSPHTALPTQPLDQCAKR